jgi:hypothetical protein
MSATLLGNLRVRLTAETDQFRRGMDSAKKSTNDMEKQLSKFSVAAVAKVASIGAITLALKQSLDVAEAVRQHQRERFAASARIAGQEHQTRSTRIVEQSREQFGFSPSPPTNSPPRLPSSQTRPVVSKIPPASSKPSWTLARLAASVCNAESLQKLTQGAVRGSDAGIAAIPSSTGSRMQALRGAFAASIGKNAWAQLTEAEKAQALVNATMRER